MAKLFGLFGGDDENNNKQSMQGQQNEQNQQREDNGTLQLRKEELDINKNRVQKGEVELSKEIIEEQKTVDVPITREEVVIERKSLNNETCDSPINSEESIRIPISEDRVDVNKHTVVTEEISARKREVDETKQVNETLRREEARIHTNGDAEIVQDDAKITNSANNNSTQDNETNNNSDSGLS